MNNNPFSHDTQNQFALSYELLRLLQWLSRHETEKLRKMITKAVKQGLHEEIQHTDTISDMNLLEDIHHSMVEFFDLLETCLHDAVSEHIENKARQKNLLPTIDQIDSSFCDTETVRLSVEKATNTLEADPHINVKEQLFKELLKKWKPLNKHCMN